MNIFYTALAYLPAAAGLIAAASLVMCAVLTKRKNPKGRIAYRAACGALGVMLLLIIVLFLCGALGIGPVPA